MEDIKATLLQLKEQALDATQRADGNFYNNYLSDDAIAIVPFGVFDKQAIVHQMSSPNSSFKSKAIEDEKVIVLNDVTGIVTYKATYEKPDASTFLVYVTTMYSKINNEWKGVFYQQTLMMNNKQE